MEELQFELLENGLDFIASGLDHIARGATKTDLKYGVLHLASGIELVLKERLRQEDWTLVFKDTDDADGERYKAGDFRSVDHKECLKRLEEECGIEISRESKGKLSAFRARRNRLEHFAIVDTKSAIESLAAQALSVLLDFISENFEDSTLSERDNELLLQIRERLREFDAFEQNRLAEMFADSNPRRDEFERLIGCPCCLHGTLRADADVECMFCGYRATGEDAANFYVAQHEASKTIYFCPECTNKTLVDLGLTGNAAPSTQFVCFGCGSQWLEGDLEICPNCEDVEFRDYMTPMGCRNCFNGYVAEDHT